MHALARIIDHSNLCTFLIFYRLEEPIMEILHGAKDVVRAFCYNSAESEAIWMKSGTL